MLGEPSPRAADAGAGTDSLKAEEGEFGHEFRHHHARVRAHTPRGRNQPRDAGAEVEQGRQQRYYDDSGSSSSSSGDEGQDEEEAAAAHGEGEEGSELEPRAAQARHRHADDSAGAPARAGGEALPRPGQTDTVSPQWGWYVPISPTDDEDDCRGAAATGTTAQQDGAPDPAPATNPSTTRRRGLPAA